MRPHAVLSHAADSDVGGGVYLDTQDARDQRISIALRAPRDDHTEAILHVDQRDAEQLALDLLEHTKPRPRDVGAWRLPDGRIYALIGAKLGAFLRPKNATQLRDALTRALRDDHAGPPMGGPRVMNRGHHTTHQTPKEVTP